MMIFRSGGDNRGLPSWRAVRRDFWLRLERKRSGKPVLPRKSVGSKPVLQPLEANQTLSTIVNKADPTMVARLGTTESSVVKYFVENQIDGLSAFPEDLKTNIRELSGVFPATDSVLSRFSRETLKHLESVDVLAVRDRADEWEFWKSEDFFVHQFVPNATLVGLDVLMPIGSSESWTASLAGKKVLVIHPFAETIRNQFRNRINLFPGSNFLPDFELTVLPAVQSIGDNAENVEFQDWFQALESMSKKIQNADFDVALVGAGAYGLFLAGEVKKTGRTAIQIGGALQLLFGIVGKRWSDPSSPDATPVIPHINEHWVTANQSEVPAGASKVEGGCYWG